jgi:hypothetical protein
MCGLSECRNPHVEALLTSTCFGAVEKLLHAGLLHLASSSPPPTTRMVQRQHSVPVVTAGAQNNLPVTGADEQHVHRGGVDEEGVQPSRRASPFSIHATPLHMLLISSSSWYASLPEICHPLHMLLHPAHHTGQGDTTPFRVHGGDWSSGVAGDIDWCWPHMLGDVNTTTTHSNSSPHVMHPSSAPAHSRPPSARTSRRGVGHATRPR